MQTLYTHSSRKLIFKQKIVTHYKRINKISINADLRVAACSGQDGLVSMVDLERYEVIRVIKLDLPVYNALIINYPYYMLLICCSQNKQYSYSLNGQFLDEANFENLHQEVKICKINGYQ
jgi:WD40 repeat protein